ncbi:CBM35 domain-containing protein [Actinoplanes sp. NPDC049668]|uniref:CBM35 domain-containing protein n=1 Tax=unclassified Actinoplanes TaxID=2626549 RepID=UPI0033A0909C
MQEDDAEPSAKPLRIGGWLPPVSAGGPAPQGSVPRATTSVPGPETAGRWSTAGRAGTRAARRRALALAQRRGGVIGAAATIAVLGVAGVLVAVISPSEPPAAIAQPPLPAAAAPSQAARPSDSSPSPSRSSATAPASHARTGRPSATGGTPAPGAGTESARPAPFQASYEAESPRNVLGGKARPLPRDDASDGLVVRFVGNGEANFLRFTGLTVPASGTYNVRVHYISGEPRGATVLVNGRLVENLTFPASPDWYTVDALVLPLTLKAGANTIEVRNDTDYAPDFDRIDLTR